MANSGMAFYPNADEEKLKWLREGKPIVFHHVPGGNLSPEERASRTLKADWLIHLAQGHEPSINVPIKIENAIIEGPLQLRNTTFRCDVEIPFFAISSILLSRHFNETQGSTAPSFYSIAVLKGPVSIVPPFLPKLPLPTMLASLGRRWGRSQILLVRYFRDLPILK